jgi:hypothetical protein
MPVKGTSGALATLKTTPIGTNNYWMLEFNSNLISFFNYTIGDSNEVYICGRRDPSSGSDAWWFNAKISQDYGTPVLGWESTLDGPLSFNDGSTNFFDSTTNQLISGGRSYTSAAFDTVATYARFSVNGTISNQIVDYANTAPSSSSQPTGRFVSDILAVANGSMWTTGTINNKPNATANLQQVYLTNSTATTKNRQIVFTTPTVGTQNMSTFLEYDNTGNLLINVQYSAFTNVNNSFVSLFNYDVANNTINWEYRLSATTTTARMASNFTKTPDGNIFVVYRRPAAVTNPGFFLYKFNSAGGVVWTRKINTSLVATAFTEPNITCDDQNNIYVTLGISTSSGQFWYVIQFDTNYNIIWQRRITGIVNINYPLWNKNNLYLTGDGASRNILIKLPDDGTLTGTYSLPSGSTMTYATTTNISTAVGNAGTPLGSSFGIGTPTNTPMLNYTYTANVATSSISYDIIP